MLIDAEYNQGQIQLIRPLRVAHQRFRVQVVIPDSEILQDNSSPPPLEAEKVSAPGENPPGSESAAQLKQLTDALFGGGYRYTQIASDKDILAEVLGEKYA